MINVFAPFTRLSLEVGTGEPLGGIFDLREFRSLLNKLFM